MRISRKTMLAVMLIAATLLLFSGCSAGSPSSEPAAMQDRNESKGADNYGYSGEEGVSEMPADAGSGESDSGGIQQPPSAPEELARKLIRDGQVQLETLEFETTVNGLYQMVADKGGFVESQTIRGGRYNYSSLRSASIVIRIPSEEYEGIMNAMDALGTVVQSDSRGTDITDQYADTESRVRNLKVQETRILELIMKAEKLEEIVTLEARLSDLRYQIESYENSLKNFDRLLAFSRISLDIEEVQRVTEVKPVPKTLGERISQAFDYAWTGLVEGSQDFAVWAVENMFGLIFLLIVLLILWVAIRGSRRRKRKEKEAWQAAHPQQPYMTMQGTPPQGMPPQGQPQHMGNGVPPQGQPPYMNNGVPQGQPPVMNTGMPPQRQQPAAAPDTGEAPNGTQKDEQNS